MFLNKLFLSIVILFAAAAAPNLLYSQEVTQPVLVITEPELPIVTENTNESYNNEGYDEKGFDKNGYDREGYDMHGYNRSGYNRNGYDRNGYDTNGNYHSQPYYYDKEDPSLNGGHKENNTKENPGYDPGGDYDDSN